MNMLMASMCYLFPFILFFLLLKKFYTPKQWWCISSERVWFSFFSSAKYSHNFQNSLSTSDNILALFFCCAVCCVSISEFRFGKLNRVVMTFQKIFFIYVDENESNQSYFKVIVTCSPWPSMKAELAGKINQSSFKNPYRPFTSELKHFPCVSVAWRCRGTWEPIYRTETHMHHLAHFLRFDVSFWSIY